MKEIDSIILSIIALTIVFFTYGCQTTKEEYKTTQGIVFGTTYHIKYAVADTSLNYDNEIKAALEEINNSLSMFKENSTMYRLNDGEDVELDSLFETVFYKGQEVSQKTNGAFDMTVGPLINLWGFGLKHRSNVSDDDVQNTLCHVGYNKVSINNHHLVKTDSLIRLDASAIAKGFACDHVAETLMKKGVTNYCVEIGGEVRLLGKNPHNNAWNIGINRPDDDTTCLTNEIIKVVKMTQGGLATSGNYRNFYIEGGKKRAHTIDPHTGYPVEHNILSASIIAKDCITADAYATACMVLGVDDALQLCAKEQIDGLFIYDDNGLKIICTKGFASYITDKEQIPEIWEPSAK